MTFTYWQKISFMFHTCEMGCFTLEKNWEILKTYFQSGESSTQTVRNLRNKFGIKEVPSSQFVDQFVKRVRETWSLLDKTTRSRSRPVRSAENIAAVAQSVLEHPSTSTLHRSQELNIPRTFLRKILHKDLGMKPYKVQMVQELKPHDYPMRFRFVQWAEDRLVEDEHLYRKIIFSDEAHFHIGIINTSISKIVAFGAQKIHTQKRKCCWSVIEWWLSVRRSVSSSSCCWAAFLYCGSVRAHTEGQY